VKCLKVRNVIQLAQAEALAAKERRESRLEHYRDDYPLTDNRDLKWVIVQGTGNKMEALLEDIPIEKWKYRPEPVLFDRLIPRKDA
jgi:succinate dehydrogenase/fumarate reductase flavoprotein subunit